MFNFRDNPKFKIKTNQVADRKEKHELANKFGGTFRFF